MRSSGGPPVSSVLSLYGDMHYRYILTFGRVYKVVTTTYICGGGDGYGSVINFSPGTLPEETNYEVHQVALNTVTARNALQCPVLEDTMTLSSSTTPLVMTHLQQVHHT